MHLLEFVGRDRKIYLPEDLSECDERQYIEMSTLIFHYQCGELSYDDVRIHGLYALMHMVRKETKSDETLKMSNIYQASQLLESFFEENAEGQKVVKQYYNHNPIKKFVGALRNYHGPADEFNNVTWGEYVDGLDHFLDFHETGELIYLYRLMAVFYRQRKNVFRRFSDWISQKDNFDIREPYNPATVEKRAKLIKRHHIGLTYGFYLFFASMQKYVATASVFVQGKEIDLSVLFDSSLLSGKKQKESDLPGLGLKGMQYTLAESGVFGSIEGVRNTPYWDVLLRLYDMVKRDQDFEANQK